MKRRPPRLPAEARRLIERLLSAIDEELTAAGPDEAKQHPTLRRKYQLCDRARRYLDRTKAAESAS